MPLLRFLSLLALGQQLGFLRADLGHSGFGMNFNTRSESLQDLGPRSRFPDSS